MSTQRMSSVSILCSDNGTWIDPFLNIMNKVSIYNSKYSRKRVDDYQWNGNSFFWQPWPHKKPHSKYVGPPAIIIMIMTSSPIVLRIQMAICLDKCPSSISRFQSHYCINELNYKTTWWRHQMETFPALLAICAGNSPVTGEFPEQRPVTRSFGAFFDLRLNKRLSKQWWDWWFETPSCPL